jgi:succinate dehydrogenase / fumarate reductase flavoprotein subunit
MPDYETLQHDVLVIGSGGAGLRAAIEASAAAFRVGMVCKCLLGKAHTVMAEGGIAAALANVDDRDNWKVHFADTMRGGQYVNNWRMAELHAKEAPDRVRELEAWGAVFDRTKMVAFYKEFRRTQISAARARGRSHRARNDSDAAGPRRAPRHRCHMEICIIALLKDGERVVGAFGYDRERGRFKFFERKQSFSPPAELARPTRSRATVGIAPAMDTHSRITPARR